MGLYWAVKVFGHAVDAKVLSCGQTNSIVGLRPAPLTVMVTLLPGLGSQSVGESDTVTGDVALVVRVAVGGVPLTVSVTGRSCASACPPTLPAQTIRPSTVRVAQ